MRHFAAFSAILCVTLFFASYASADEAAGRVAIGRAIASLNDGAQHDALFTADGDAASEFDRLQKAHPLSFRILAPSRDVVSGALTLCPPLTISREPWGELKVVCPTEEPRPAKSSVTFVTPGVALVEGAFTYQNDYGTTLTAPLLFVMKKEGGDWKIASLQVLEPR